MSEKAARYLLLQSNSTLPQTTITMSSGDVSRPSRSVSILKIVQAILAIFVLGLTAYLEYYYEGDYKILVPLAIVSRPAEAILSWLYAHIDLFSLLSPLRAFYSTMSLSPARLACTHGC